MSQIGEEGLKKREENSQEAPDEQSVWIQFPWDVGVFIWMAPGCTLPFLITTMNRYYIENITHWLLPIFICTPGLAVGMAMLPFIHIKAWEWCITPKSKMKEFPGRFLQLITATFLNGDEFHPKHWKARRQLAVLVEAASRGEEAMLCRLIWPII